MRNEAPKRMRCRFLYVVLIAIAATVAGFGVPGLLVAESQTIFCNGTLIAAVPQPMAHLGWSASASGDWLAAGAIQNNMKPGSVALYKNPGTDTNPHPHPDQEFTAGDPHPGDQFGTSVSISQSISNPGVYWLAAGAPAGGGRVQDSGVVYIFRYDGQTWSQQAKLDAGDATQGAQFGFSVSLSASLSGTTFLVVGAPTDSGGGSFAGAAYVFELPSGISGPWSQTAKLLANDFRPFDEFGSAVATDGSEIVVGSPFADDLTVFKNFGAAYVFHKVGAWTLEDHGKLTAGPFRAGNIQFGAAVAIAGDLIGVGAPGYDNTNPNLTDSGSAYVFERNGTDWISHTLLPEEPVDGAQFGTAVQIDGNDVLIGAPFDGQASAGASYLFEPSNDIWNQKFKILNTQGGAFGQSVAALNDKVFMGGFQYLAAADAMDSGGVAVCPTGQQQPTCPTITKTDNLSTVEPGQTIIYQIHVTAGDSDATVRDPFPQTLEAVGWCPGQDCTDFMPKPFVATVLATHEAFYRLRGRVPADATGEISNTAYVKSSDCAETSATDTDPIKSGPVLVVTKDDGLTEVSPGQTVTYTITVKNIGDGPAPAVAVTDTFSPKLQNVSWSDQTISLAAGQSKAFTATGTVAQNACGTLTNRACAQLLPAGPTACGDDPQDQIIPPVDLALAADPNPSCSTLSYMLILTNPRAAASGSVQVTTGTGNGLTPITPTDPRCQVVAANIVCTLNSVAANATVKIPVSFRIPECYAGPNPILVAAVLGTNCDPAHDQRSLAIPVNCAPPDLAITKTHEPAVLVPGQAMAYVITVRNNGPSDAPGATVTDSLPSALLGPHCVGANSLDCTFLGNNLNIAVGPLPAGGEAIYRIEGQLTAQCISTLSNTATVSPLSCVDPDPSNNTATDTAPIPPTSGVSIHCSGVSDAFEGDFVTFTYVLSNGGPNAQADNPGPEFTDTLPAGLTLVTATASSGTVTTAANTVSWNGSIPVCGTVTIAVQATVNAGTAGMTLCNQGNVAFDANGDGINESSASATCCVSIHATPPPPKIPTLGPAGLAALMILLACVALLRLRRRSL